MRTRLWVALGLAATAAGMTVTLAADPPAVPLPAPGTPNAYGGPPVPVLPPLGPSVTPSAAPGPAPTAPTPIALTVPTGGVPSPPPPLAHPYPLPTPPVPELTPLLPLPAPPAVPLPAAIDVQGPDPVLVRAVRAEVRFQYAELAGQFLGAPDRPHPPINVSVNEPAPWFHSLGKQEVRVPVVLKGTYEDVLGKQLRPRLLPAVLGTPHNPAPAWAELGLGALGFRTADEQRALDRLNRERVAAGRAFTLASLFDKPASADEAFVAQSHAVVRFLAERKRRGESPRKGVSELADTTGAVLAFTAAADPGVVTNDGTRWDRAARSVFKFDSVEDMQDHWLLWLKRPASRPGAAPEPTTAPPAPGLPALIPATPVAAPEVVVPPAQVNESHAGPAIPPRPPVGK